MEIRAPSFVSKVILHRMDCCRLVGGCGRGGFPMLASQSSPRAAKPTLQRHHRKDKSCKVHEAQDPPQHDASGGLSCWSSVWTGPRPSLVQSLRLKQAFRRPSRLGILPSERILKRTTSLVTRPSCLEAGVVRCDRRLRANHNARDGARAYFSYGTLPDRRTRQRNSMIF